VKRTESERIDAVWALLNEHDCLPYAASVRDVVPEERPATAEETEQIKAADREADQRNREFCRRIIEAATDVVVRSVG